MREIKTVGKQKARDNIYPRLTLTGPLVDLGIKPGDEVLVEVKDGQIVIRPTKR